MSDPKITKVEMGSKYAITFSYPLTASEIDKIRKAWDEFIKSEGTELIILDGGAQIMRIEE